MSVNNNNIKVYIILIKSINLYNLSIKYDILINKNIMLII